MTKQIVNSAIRRHPLQTPIAKPGACSADRAPNSFAFVAAEVIEHHDVAGSQGLDQLGLDISVECLGINLPADDPRRLDVIMP